MYIRFIVILTGRSGRRAWQDQPHLLPFLQNWTMTYGWVQPPKKIISTGCFPSTGVAGGITEPALSAIWPVISWLPHLPSWISDIRFLRNAVWPQNILKTGTRDISRTVVRLLP